MTLREATNIDVFQAFDLEAELKALESRKPWAQRMTSKILLKTDDLRILLIAMESGALMKEHHSDGRISIHALRGSIRVRLHGEGLADETTELAAGHLITLDRLIRHDVLALGDSAFLLTIAWPTDRELAGLVNQGGHNRGQGYTLPPAE